MATKLLQGERAPPAKLALSLAAQNSAAARSRARTVRMLGLVGLGVPVGLAVFVVLGAVVTGMGALVSGASAMHAMETWLGVVVSATGLLCPLSIMPPIFCGIAYAVGKTSFQRAQGKRDFATGLLTALMDDLDRARDVELRLDDRAYDLKEKVSWSGKTQHGNSKYRYDDRWLDLRGWLIDGTRIKIRRTSDVKTKKGGIVKEKRRADVALRLPPGLPDPDPLDIEAAALEAVATCFHDPPEGLRAEASPVHGEVRIKVMQLNAPILVDEVVALAEACLAAARHAS